MFQLIFPDDRIQILSQPWLRKKQLQPKLHLQKKLKKPKKQLQKKLLLLKKTTTTKKSTTIKKAKAPAKATPVKKSKAVEKTTIAPVEATAAPIEKAAAVKSKAKEPLEVDEFLENFNWHNYQEGIDVIEDDQLKEFEALVAENFVDTADEDVLDGIIIHLTDREAIIDINAKSEGVISLNEFRYNPDLEVRR